ncbi:hypothetical protein XENTR_v10001245 [Xenopus tropicalis]|uniref:Small integral membrane protein 24 n=1 Tax=Xenopus tropicalis TaxID=8364 RepID=A0A8J0QUF3_XENTR|eukprot:XP_002938869.1 PREDICTED: small integral membrane protein 24 [Xenopus tropicalis]
MSTLCSVVIGLILAFSAMAQGAERASSGGNSYALQPWLLGLTAVVVFLFIVFILLIVNRLWCKKEKHESNEENPKEERVEINAYENKGLEKDDDDEDKKKEQNKKEAKWEKDEKEDSKITAM